MTSNSRDAVIVRSTVDLGRNLGLRVVAEGVEDPATWQELDALGCDAIQGYYVSRPVPQTTSFAGLNNSRRPGPARSASTDCGLAGGPAHQAAWQLQQLLAQLGPLAPEGPCAYHLQAALDSLGQCPRRPRVA
jgi:hypothetical protein